MSKRVESRKARLGSGFFRARGNIQTCIFNYETQGHKRHGANGVVYKKIGGASYNFLSETMEQYFIRLVLLTYRK
jgi:hypothetical protein